MADPELVVVGRVLLAAALGGLLGLERELHGKPAGLRTHMLVAASAALFVALGDTMIAGIRPGQRDVVDVDPVRVIQSIVTAIGFLGAGTIVVRRQGEAVEGLTTAATILLSAALGTAVGLRQYLTAGALTVVLALGVAVLGRVERWLAGRLRHDPPP